MGGGENFRKKTCSGAKFMCLVRQWNQYHELHFNERTESLIDHKKSLLISCLAVKYLIACDKGCI